jgi:hypothetical protein
MEGARNEWSMIVARGVVVIYFARLGGRLRNDQKIMLDADAQAIAKLKGYDFGEHHQAAHDYSGRSFSSPTTLYFGMRRRLSAFAVRMTSTVE